MGRHKIIVKSRFIAFFVCFFALCCLSCWDKQKRELLPPTVPSYILSGYTVDRDNPTNVLSHIPITLIMVKMLYDITFLTVSIESDSNGYFQFHEVYPGNYYIKANRDGFTVISDMVSIGHEDRTFNINLPKPLLSWLFYRAAGGNNPVFTVAQSGLWIMSKEIRMKPPQIFIDVVYYCKITPNIYIKDHYINTPYNAPRSLHYANRLLYFYSNGLITSLRTSEQTIWDLVINETFEVNEKFTDMTSDRSGFWTTYGSSIQYRGNDIKSVEKSWTVDAGRLGPITIHGDNYLIFDTSEDLLLVLNQDKQVSQSFRLIDFDTGSWIDAFDIDISPMGTLIATKPDINGFYEFSLESIR
ncbi:MAG: carboxypeptidase regulatory-like domain-containing protein [Candidatus Marinimicrobia bacterium]|nr:carboxypeptidase regulatory-like domain-containing protein [Candidatus Neomarinimicrobiota bacterium]